MSDSESKQQDEGSIDLSRKTRSMENRDDEERDNVKKIKKEEGIEHEVKDGSCFNKIESDHLAVGLNDTSNDNNLRNHGISFLPSSSIDLKQSRTDHSERPIGTNVPRRVVLTIPSNRRGAFIGTGGCNINAVVRYTGATIIRVSRQNVADNPSLCEVTIESPSLSVLSKAIRVVQEFCLCDCMFGWVQYILDSLDKEGYNDRPGEQLYNSTIRTNDSGSGKQEERMPALLPPEASMDEASRCPSTNPYSKHHPLVMEPLIGGTTNPTSTSHATTNMPISFEEKIRMARTELPLIRIREFAGYRSYNIEQIRNMLGIQLLIGEFDEVPFDINDNPISRNHHNTNGQCSIYIKEGTSQQVQSGLFLIDYFRSLPRIPERRMSWVYDAMKSLSNTFPRAISKDIVIDNTDLMTTAGTDSASSTNQQRNQILKQHGVPDAGTKAQQQEAEYRSNGIPSSVSTITTTASSTIENNPMVTTMTTMSLEEFLMQNVDCFKCSVQDFYEWLQSEYVVTIRDFAEAIQDNDFVQCEMKQHGLKGFKIRVLQNACLQLLEQQHSSTTL